jgi:hypothetical protein
VRGSERRATDRLSCVVTHGTSETGRDDSLCQDKGRKRKGQQPNDRSKKSDGDGGQMWAAMFVHGWSGGVIPEFIGLLCGSLSTDSAHLRHKSLSDVDIKPIATFCLISGGSRPG